MSEEVKKSRKSSKVAPKDAPARLQAFHADILAVIKKHEPLCLPFGEKPYVKGVGVRPIRSDVRAEIVYNTEIIKGTSNDDDDE